MLRRAVGHVSSLSTHRPIGRRSWVRRKPLQAEIIAGQSCHERGMASQISIGIPSQDKTPISGHTGTENQNSGTGSPTSRRAVMIPVRYLRISESAKKGMSHKEQMGRVLADEEGKKGADKKGTNSLTGKEEIEAQANHVVEEHAHPTEQSEKSSPQEKSQERQHKSNESPSNNSSSKSSSSQATKPQKDHRRTRDDVVDPYYQHRNVYVPGDVVNATLFQRCRRYDNDLPSASGKLDQPRSVHPDDMHESEFVLTLFKSKSLD